MLQSHQAERNHHITRSHEIAETRQRVTEIVMLIRAGLVVGTKLHRCFRRSTGATDVMVMHAQLHLVLIAMKIEIAGMLSTVQITTIEEIPVDDTTTMIVEIVETRSDDPPMVDLVGMRPIEHQLIDAEEMIAMSESTGARAQVMTGLHTTPMSTHDVRGIDKCFYVNGTVTSCRLSRSLQTAGTQRHCIYSIVDRSCIVLPSNVWLWQMSGTSLMCSAHLIHLFNQGGPSCTSFNLVLGRREPCFDYHNKIRLVGPSTSLKSEKNVKLENLINSKFRLDLS